MANCSPMSSRAKQSLTESHEELRCLPIPTDDSRDVILEVKAGEGGEESALFAGDLLRMYRFAELKGMAHQTLSATESYFGGYKVTAKSPQPPEDPADGVWAHLKYAGGRAPRGNVCPSPPRPCIHTSRRWCL